MKKEKHARLRGAMKAKGAGQADIAALLDILQPTVSHKLCGHSPFTISEAWALMAFLDLPPAEMAEFFPDECASGKNISVSSSRRRKAGA